MVWTGYLVFRDHTLRCFPGSRIDEDDIKKNYIKDIRKPGMLEKWEEKARAKNAEKIWKKKYEIEQKTAQRTY